jgi:hypothetical protein
LVATLKRAGEKSLALLFFYADIRNKTLGSGAVYNRAAP